MDVLSQNMRIREDLLAGRVISSLTALNDYGCLRLSARIWDLIHKYGLKISKKKGEQKTINGTKYFALYYIKEEERKRILEGERND